MVVDKRTAILDAAEGVLVEHGLAGGTVDQITARAGVAKGTFYLYFRSKDDVVAALQERLWQGMVDLGMAAVGRLDDGDFWSVADDFVEECIAFDMAHRSWHQAVWQGWSGVFAAEAGREQQLIDLFRVGIEAGNEAGACDVDDPEMTAILVYRAIEGTSHQMARSDDDVDQPRLVAALQRFLRNALRAPADA